MQPGDLVEYLSLNHCWGYADDPVLCTNQDLAGESERQMTWQSEMTAADVLTLLRAESFRLGSLFRNRVGRR